MNKIVYVPLEHIDSRYTVHLDHDITKHLNEFNYDYLKIYPDVAPERPLPPGMFLDAPFTTRFKSLQLAEIAKLFEEEWFEDGDVIFFSDIWFPGIEAIAYMSHFTGVRVKIRGILHAGSFTDTDEVRQFERWAKNFEDIVFDIADRVYVASEFIKADVIKKRFIDPEKLVVTPLPLDVSHMKEYKHDDSRQPIVVFNGRDHIEKQPWLFDELQKRIRERFDTMFQMEGIETQTPKFIWTQKEGYSKDEYYKLLSEAAVVVSFALQENFGYGIAEATYLGCVPVVPDRLVYPEIYDKNALYTTFDEAVDKVFDILVNGPQEKVYVKKVKMIRKGNLDSIPKWFQ